MEKSWRQRNNGAGYEIQQFRQDENFCRIQAGEHGGVHVRIYESEEKEEGEREMSKINVMLYGGFDKKTKNRAETIYCDKCEYCSLYARGLCLNVTEPFSPRCKFGRVSVEHGYTQRAQKRYTFDSKHKNDEKYGALKHPNDWSVEIVQDTVLFNLVYAVAEKKRYIFNEWKNTDEYFVNDCGFSVGNVSYVEKTELTSELIEKIASRDARALMGGKIEAYRNKIVPNILDGIRKKLPEIYEKFILEYPEYKDISPNYIGRMAKISTLADGIKLYSSGGVFEKRGDKLISEEYKSVFLPFNCKKARVEIPITGDMTYRIKYNSQVNENTEFV